MIPQYYFNESVNIKIKETAMPRMPRMLIKHGYKLQMFLFNFYGRLFFVTQEKIWKKIVNTK